MTDRVERNEPPGLLGRFFAVDDRRALAKLVIGVAVLVSIVLIFATTAGLAIRFFVRASGLAD